MLNFKLNAIPKKKLSVSKPLVASGLLGILVMLNGCSGGGHISSNNSGPASQGGPSADKGKDGFSYMQDGSGSSDVDLIRHKNSF